jgi:hypothetical protein
VRNPPLFDIRNQLVTQHRHGSDHERGLPSSSAERRRVPTGSCSGVIKILYTSAGDLFRAAVCVLTARRCMT